VFRVIETLHGANFVVEIVAEAILRCSLNYGDPYIGSVLLLAHFDGTDGSTTFLDASPYHNTLTGVGNAEITTGDFKFGGGSLLLENHAINGDNVGLSNVNFGQLSPTNTSPYTIELWALFNSTGILQYLITQTAGLGSRHFAMYQDGDDEITWHTSSNLSAWTHEFKTSGANIVTGQFYSIILDKDSTGTVRIYVDGVMYAKQTPANSAINTTNGTQLVIIGSHGVLNADSFDGCIDEVRVTAGISRYGDLNGDTSFTPPSSSFPET